ncbi:MAG: cytochrome c family protein [Acidobacteriia bacterium]|nr:cytochrome c family protein [Terriglobia bacterium]
MRAMIPFVAGAIVALGAGWAGFPHVIYKSRPQPVDFSHRVHADKAGAKCEDCHAFRGDGTFAGIPTLDKCAGCHAAPMGDTPAEKNFIDQYVTPQREPQWAAYARQPENVFFSHIAHVKLGQVKCESCHGNQGSTDKLPLYQEDRISGYSRDIWGTAGRPAMTMDNCVDCHRQQKLEHSCLDCHK